ncbi:aminopeptidase [Bacillus rhizoplanae]|uniref:aminopeptidase n=1 Tax=Bacillus rhizoplanae TaxID=2880966 RepID=UPI003D235B37
MTHFKENLKKYAQLVIQMGINIQEGQTLVIHAPITSAHFVRELSKQAYKSGAKNVHVEYSDEDLTLIKYLYSPLEGLKEFPHWKAKGLVELAKNNAAFLYIDASNPTLLQDINAERLAIAMKTNASGMKELNEYRISSQCSWSIISVPTIEWASQIFPELSAEEGVNKLWDLIFKITRVTDDNPIQAWQEHIQLLNSKAHHLNARKYKKLHYKSDITDLTIEFPDNHKWLSAQFQNKLQTPFIPNMPTEEVFTVPLKTGVNGVVGSTKPLNYGSTLIKDFSLTFREGKVVDCSAETGYETLKKLLETDEGALHLGEVALVPHDSPISNTNVVFFNTLFDENASCHLALGNALPMCIQDGINMSKEELQGNGLNDSITHVDFMIGSPDLDIDGETSDGKLEPIFRKGNWAF